MQSSSKGSSSTAADVCSDFLCGLCPYDLLENTQGSLGPCPKVHSDETRLIYMETLLTDPGVSVMEAHKRSLEGILTRRNRKVQQTKLRMTEYVDSEEVESCQRQIHELDIEATHYMLKRDNVSVDEVAHNWNELKNLTKQQSFLMERMRKQSSEKSANDRERQLAVCRTCALHIDLHISDERKHIHTQSSTHQAFMKIEAKLAELEKVP